MPTSQESVSPPNTQSEDQSARLERAMRRAELLSYAATGLGIALLAVIVGISLL